MLVGFGSGLNVQFYPADVTSDAEAYRVELAEFEGPDGVTAPASTWIIGARAPQ